ncbi:hypothetical protein BGX33_011329 [Mortierella sp. NVP41]|nr:hypothetical protein BGX33_011329 [Mortierella sp. NVP41]
MISYSQHTTIQEQDIMEREEASVHSGRPRDRRPPAGGWELDPPRIVHSIVHVDPQGELYCLQSFSDDFHQLVQDQKETDPYDAYFADNRDLEREITDRVDTWSETETVNEIFGDPTVLGLLQEWQEERLQNAAGALENPNLRPNWSSVFGKVDDVTDYGDQSNLHLRGRITAHLGRPGATGDDNVRRLLSSADRGHRRVPYVSGRGRFRAAVLKNAKVRQLKHAVGAQDQEKRQKQTKQANAGASSSTSAATSSATNSVTTDSHSTTAIVTTTNNTSIVDTASTTTTDTVNTTSATTTATTSLLSTTVTTDTNILDNLNSEQQPTVITATRDKAGLLSAPHNMETKEYQQLRKDARLIEKLAEERTQQEIVNKIAKTPLENKFQKCSLMLEDCKLETLSLRSELLLPVKCRPPLNLLPIPPHRFSRPFVPVMENELIVSVALYNTHRPGQRMQEFLFLGSQRLSALRDAFDCTSDFAIREWEEIPGEVKSQNTADKKTSNSFIFIEGVFYSDSPLIRAKLERRDQLREEASTRLKDLEKQRQERYQEAVRIRNSRRLQMREDTSLGTISHDIDGSDDDDMELEFDDSDLQRQMEASIYHEQPIEDITVENQDVLEKISEDYSQKIMDWVAEKPERKRERGFRNLKKKYMHDIQIQDLSIRLNQPYLLVHQGDCEHILMFRDLRLYSQRHDDLNRLSYPLMVFKSKTTSHMCRMCNINKAYYVTVDDRLAGETPCYFCEQCYDSFHYDADGNILYDDFRDSFPTFTNETTQDQDTFTTTHQPTTMALSTLAQLAEQSKQLTSHIGGLQVPQIKRGIDQIENQSRKLATKASKPIDATDNKGPFFLAKGGIDANLMNTTLNSINLKSTFEPFQPIHDTDTESFLRHQHEQIILNTIDESRRETVMDFDSNFETSLNYDWERTKKRIFEELGQHQGQSGRSDADLGQSNRSFRGTASMAQSQHAPYAPGFSQNTVSLDATFSKLKPYYKVVYDLCEARLQGPAFSLASNFVDASRLAHKDQPNPKITETWELLVSVLGEQDFRNGQFQNMALKERVYAKAYLMSPYRSLNAAVLRERLIMGSKTFLEKQFWTHIQASVAENPAEANLGGVPSLINTIRAFVQLKYLRYGSWSQPNLEIVNGQAVWAQIYYLFRTGHVRDAVRFATENELNFNPADRPFITYLATYFESEDRTLPANEQDRLRNDFNNRIRYSSDTVDPYKLTLFKIIGQCELTKRTTPVIGAVEDFIWLHLSLIREPKSDTVPHEKYDLADFQALVLKYGPAHFNPNGNNPLQYFQVLIHSQQFERAIHYLYSFKAYALETVHMAIALTYYGLLRIPSVHRVSDPNPFSTTTDAQGHEIAHFNFTHLVHYQARIIAERYPTEALSYLYQICLNTDLTQAINQEQIALCHSYIKELVLQAKDYTTLLGSAAAPGMKTPGVIERYLPLIKIADSHQFVKDITVAAAQSKAKEGRVADAIQLYRIAESYNQVVELLNRQLAEFVSNPGLANTGEAGLDIPSIRRLVTEFSSPKISGQIMAKNSETCNTLLKLIEFTEYYDRGNYVPALGVIEDLKLIPLEADMTQIAKAADQFQALDECVARNLPDILHKTMDSLYKQYQTLKSSPYDDAGRQDSISVLKRRARTLMMFSGSIKFRMPAETYAKLNRLDVMIAA